MYLYIRGSPSGSFGSFRQSHFWTRADVEAVDDALGEAGFVEADDDESETLGFCWQFARELRLRDRSVIGRTTTQLSEVASASRTYK